MKTNYSRNIPLQCITCGSDSSFEKDENTGVIRCWKCNRVYYGGYEELKEMNRRLIEETENDMIDEVKEDLVKDINDMFRKAGFKVR